MVQHYILNICMNTESVGKGQGFGICRVLVSICSLVCSPSSVDQCLWLHAGKQSVWRAKEAEHIDQNAILEPISYHLVAI